jgi:hypothetical protein
VGASWARRGGAAGEPGAGADAAFAQAPRPSTGPHKLRESMPLVVLLRERLKYALTRKEVTAIVQQRLIQVDGKVRTDDNFPVGYQGTPPPPPPHCCARAQAAG